MYRPVRVPVYAAANVTTRHVYTDLDCNFMCCLLQTCVLAVYVNNTKYSLPLWSLLHIYMRVYKQIGIESSAIV